MAYRVSKIGRGTFKQKFKTKAKAKDWAKHVLPHVGYKIVKVKK